METQPKVLLVDDDRTFTPLIQEYLTAKGMVVEMRHNGDDGLAAFLSGNFHLCVLDVKMPMKDGFTLAQEIRERDAHMPFIFLSAQSEKESRIKGLLLGADDYITKPFSMEELFLRITAILRRVGVQQQQQRETPQVYQVGKFTFSPTTRELTADGFLQKMTGTEAKLLEMFLENESGTIEREQALRRVWGDEDYLRGRSLNVYVSKLRHFLKDDPRIEILNRHGEGYRLVVR
ncbi:MAG: response regulator transcription factor [Saprospiraceae bacterium]